MTGRYYHPSSTLPKRWQREGWVDLGSDVNWEEYDGMWGRPASHEPAGVWYILRFTNMVNACGERSATEMGIRYECTVLRVDLTALTRGKKEAVLAEFGDTEEWDDAARTSGLVYGLASSGCAAPMHEESSWNYPARVRAAAKRAADKMMNDYDLRETQLDKPYNAIGTTCREVGQDDLLAGLRRYAATDKVGTDTKMDLMLRIGGVPPAEPVAEPASPEPVAEVKRVKQREMSGECMQVQIWGTSTCLSCEYKDTPDCGGVEIRKTGQNSKAQLVGKKGL